jgi:hypothetical protein
MIVVQQFSNENEEFYLLGCNTMYFVENHPTYETSVDFQQTTWHYIPEDRTLHNDWCGKGKR